MDLTAFNFTQAQKLLRDALLEMLKEQKLFSATINERTLTQRLAFFIQLAIGSQASVDCEYNRMCSNGADLAKRLGIDITQTRTDDTEGSTVYPDVIVHNRRQTGADYNYLVIEAKKNSATDSVPTGDETKLIGFTSPSKGFKYRWGAFVNFRLSGREKLIEIIWFEKGERTTHREPSIHIPADAFWRETAT